jgi:glucosylceramidase
MSSALMLVPVQEYNMKLTTAILAIGIASVASTCMARPQVRWWLTTADRSALFTEQKAPLAFEARSASTKLTADDDASSITVDPSKTYQTIDGFGFALTGGSAQHLMAMSPGARRELLTELFATKDDNIGISYLRVSIGSSDLNDHVYSYDDIADGETDMTLSKFTLAEDEGYVIPAIKEILAINPKIKLLGSPWSAPKWMKTNDNVKGGTLKDECYPIYASYLVKYVEGMKAHGISIDAITPQNEPYNDGNTPSMQLFPEQEMKLVRDDLGPAFQTAGLKTKIVVYDHNCDAYQYPLTILNDPAAREYVDGSGFHLYGGDVSAMTTVHNAYPDKNVYFTEQMVVSIKGFDPVRSVSRVLIGATRNWSRNVLLWNLAADSAFQPHTGSGGCPICQGAVTIDGDKVERNVAFYDVAHFSKFVRPGSVRIDSTETDALPNVAFRTPTGNIVDVVANTSKSPQTVDIVCGGKAIHPTLPASSVATFVW